MIKETSFGRYTQLSSTKSRYLRPLLFDVQTQYTAEPCTDALTSQVRYDPVKKKVYFCDGNEWRVCNQYTLFSSTTEVSVYQCLISKPCNSK